MALKLKYHAFKTGYRITILAWSNNFPFESYPMRHFPIFADLNDRKIVVSGVGAMAEAKLRLLMKTGASIFVYGEAPASIIKGWAKAKKITLIERAIVPADTIGATLVYCASGDNDFDLQTAASGRANGAMVNVVDNLEASDFITPAIVDRSPVTVAIGTEGTAPVLARKIKSDIETTLPHNLGLLARISEKFRPKVQTVPNSRTRRKFWQSFFFDNGPVALNQNETGAAIGKLNQLLDKTLAETPEQGRVSFLGAGPGDPHLLTVKASTSLQSADLIVHDAGISSEIIDIARREAKIVEYGPDSNSLMVEYASQGNHVVRLKAGDPSIFGRLNGEIEALDNAQILYEIVPGISSTSAASALMLGNHPPKDTRNEEFEPIKQAGE